MRYRQVIFDLDGTLVDSLADIAHSANRMLARLGAAPLHVDRVRESIGDGVRSLVQRLLGEPLQARLDEALALFLADYREHILDHTDAYPGVPVVLAELAARGVGMSVLTNKLEAMTRTILAGLHLDRYFPIVIGGDSLPTKKPDPAGVHHILERTGTPTTATLLVGDSTIDQATARAAQVEFCGVTWGFGSAALQAQPGGRLIASPAELLDLVR